MNLNSSRGRRAHPTKLKARLREVTVTAILDAAEQVLRDRGPDAPMELIASRAGVAVGTLYNHFTDRRALVQALFVRHREAVGVELEAAIAATDGQPIRARLLALVQTMHAGWARLQLLLREADRTPDARHRRAVRERMQRTLGGVLSAAHRAGELTADPHGLQVVAFLGLLLAFFRLGDEDPALLAADRVAEAVVDTFLNGFAARARSRR
jgi:AcrR family transcriptional regulator